MVWEVNGKPYHFDKDFKELHAKQRISVVKMVRNLLKLQKDEESILANVTATPTAETIRVNFTVNEQ